MNGKAFALENMRRRQMDYYDYYYLFGIIIPDVVQVTSFVSARHFLRVKTTLAHTRTANQLQLGDLVNDVA